MGIKMRLASWLAGEDIEQLRSERTFHMQRDAARGELLRRIVDLGDNLCLANLRKDAERRRYQQAQLAADMRNVYGEVA